MKSFIISISIVVCGLCFFSCKNKPSYDKYVKELDSLKVVVEQAVDNFRGVDSTTCVLAYNKQLAYSSFINEHLKDTVSKIEAENLQLFQSTHEGIKNYLAHRSEWLQQAHVSIKQLSSLSHDLKVGSVETEDAIEYINNEKKAAEKTIEELKINTETIRVLLNNYTKSLPVTEDLVRSLNNGALVPVSNSH